MKDFVLIFRLNNIADFKPTPEQNARTYELACRHRFTKQISWQRQYPLPIASSAKTIKADKVVTDGPFTEIKEFISGYVVVKAENIDEAVEMAKANPIFEQVGGSIEVREVLKRD